jgi:hypothetical protein
MDSEQWQINDIVSRIGTDEQVIKEINHEFQTLTVEVIKADDPDEKRQSVFAVGDEEINMMDRYLFVRRETKPEDLKNSEDNMSELDNYCQCKECLKSIKQGWVHYSDCAVHNEPAFPAGQCDCNGMDILTGKDFKTSKQTIFKCKCQICDEIYAVIDLEDIKYPLNGSMFKSPDPAHGVPDPFYPGAEFEYMHCPFGQHRPMIMPNTILCDNGKILNVPDRAVPFFTPLGEERQYTLDRDQVLPVPMMSEEVAGRIARGLPAEEIKTDGETEIQQGQQTDQEPVEEKKEANSEPAANYCVACKREFNNKAGFRNHMRIKHKITNPEDYNK